MTGDPSRLRLGLVLRALRTTALGLRRGDALVRARRPTGALGTARSNREARGRVEQLCCNCACIQQLLQRGLSLRDPLIERAQRNRCFTISGHFSTNLVVVLGGSTRGESANLSNSYKPCKLSAYPASIN
jgi:hypothetical protein